MSLCGQEDVSRLPPHEPLVTSLPSWAQGPGLGRPRLLLLDPPRTVLGALDAAKCADVVLAVVGPAASLEESAFDDQGYKLLTALKAQGLPVVFGAIHGPEARVTQSGLEVGGHGDLGQEAERGV